jgi:DNA-binding HxlR family transcriptional regulator
MAQRKKLDHLQCSVANTLEVIGDQWTVLILRDAFMGVRRFDEFQSDLGIARNILSDRLERLVAAGIMELRPYQEHPPRHEYRLTTKGKDLFDVLLALWRWGDRWLPVADEVERHLVHVECGHATHAVASCAHCGKQLLRSDLRIEPGLSVTAGRSVAPV